MWTCPECGRQFANVNQWHSCVELSLTDHLADKSPLAVAIYEAVETAMRKTGEFRIHPQKTRIAFISTMTFAGLRLSGSRVDLSFITADPIDDARITRIDLYGPTSFSHTVRLRNPAEVDDTIAGWLAESLRRGNQETLDATAAVEPLRGRSLTIIHIPVRARIEPADDGLSLRVPPYATDALAAAPAIAVRLLGRDHPAELTPTGVRLLDDALHSAGLGPGDELDVTLRAG